MCGLAGIFSAKSNSIRNKSIVKSMLDSIRFRGPDDIGTWQNDQITIGHVRLSIVDLSAAGHQPMISASSRYIVVYNGEVYNASDLVNDLPKDLHFRGHSDTEVILHAFDCWGIESTVKKMRGMFALAVYDQQTNLLHLIRDPIGIKPLYYGFADGNMFFGSQIKSFLKTPYFKKNICEKALGLYLKYNYIPAPYAIYQDCYKQKPGTILTFEEGKLVKETIYWSLEQTYLKGKAHNPK